MKQIQLNIWYTCCKNWVFTGKPKKYMYLLTNRFFEQSNSILYISGWTNFLARGLDSEDDFNRGCTTIYNVNSTLKLTRREKSL